MLTKSTNLSLLMTRITSQAGPALVRTVFMSVDPLSELLGLEDEFYQEGYEAGVADSLYAGMIEGKVFGIEKGYEKAFELAKLHGRSLVWHARLDDGGKLSPTPGADLTNTSDATLDCVVPIAGKLPQNSRLQKNVENLLAISSDAGLSKENSDEAVADFDDRLAKARTKAKMIANVTGESVGTVSHVDRGIEDSTGLNARH